MLNHSKVSAEQSKIKLFQPDRVWQEIKEEVFDLVDQSHRQGQAQNGQLTQQLESHLALKFNRQYCITTACATDALDIALQSLNLPSHSCIAVPDYTFTATAHAVVRSGHQLSITDVDNNYCIDSTKIKNVNAVVSVDLFGNMSDYNSLYQLGLPVIVDAAQSLESIDANGVASAKHGVLSCISFSPSKTVSSWGSGGAILTDDIVLADRCRRLRLHGKLSNQHTSIAPGLNSMMSSFECAAVIVGLARSDKWQARRKNIADYLISQSQWATCVDSIKQHTLSKLVFQSDCRDTVIKSMSAMHVETAIHYNTLISDEQIYSCSNIFLNSNRLKNISFTVPNQHTLTDNEVEIIAQGLQ
jgi:dTDP-4-amino-4,6-dideoxygalactose transaminase